MFSLLPYPGLPAIEHESNRDRDWTVLIANIIEYAVWLFILVFAYLALAVVLSRGIIFWWFRQQLLG